MVEFVEKSHPRGRDFRLDSKGARTKSADPLHILPDRLVERVSEMISPGEFNRPLYPRPVKDEDARISRSSLSSLSAIRILTRRPRTPCDSVSARTKTALSA